MPNFGPISAADIKTRLAHLCLCDDLHAAEGGAVSQEQRSLGRQLSLRGRERRGCSQAGDTNLRWGAPRKHENKIKRFYKGFKVAGPGGSDLETWKSRGDDTATREGSAVAVHDACTTVSICSGDNKKKATVLRFFARGRRSKNQYADRQKTQDGTYGGFRASPKKTNYENSFHPTAFLHPSRLLLPPLLGNGERHILKTNSNQITQRIHFATRRRKPI